MSGGTATELMRYLAGFGVHTQQGVQGGTGVSPVFLHGDLTRSTMMTTDTSATVLSRVAYTAFGDPVTWDEGTETWRVGWPVDMGTRYQYDGGWGYESGGWGPGAGGSGTGPGPLALWGDNTSLPPVTLQHVGWRWYQPGIGRFIQRDPIGLLGGFNLYTYVFCEPLAQLDVDGFLPHNALAMGAVYHGWRNAGKSVDEAVKWTERWAIETGMIETTGVLLGAGGRGPNICIRAGFHRRPHPFRWFGPRPYRLAPEPLPEEFPPCPWDPRWGTLPPPDDVIWPPPGGGGVLH